MSAGLDATTLVERAQQETGLTDYGDPSLPQRFAMVVEHLNGIGMNAEQRAKLVEHVKEHRSHRRW